MNPSTSASVPRPPASSALLPSNLRPAAVAATSTIVVPQRAPARPPLVHPLLHHSSLRPNSPRSPPTIGQFPSPGGNLLQAQQREGLRLPAPHLQAAAAASRPSSSSSSSSPSLPPPPGYQRPASTSSARPPHLPKPTLGRTAMADRADQLAVAAAAGSLGSQRTQASDLDWFRGITNRQLSNLQRLPPTDSSTSTTNNNGPSLSETRQMGGTADKPNGSAIINASNIICLSDEE